MSQNLEDIVYQFLSHIRTNFPNIQLCIVLDVNEYTIQTEPYNQHDYFTVVFTKKGSKVNHSVSCNLTDPEKTSALTSGIMNIIK